MIGIRWKAMTVVFGLMGIPLLAAASFIGDELNVSDGTLVYRQNAGSSNGDGFVGIGMTSPSRNLMVSGNVMLRGGLITSENQITQTSGTITIPWGKANRQTVTVTAATTFVFSDPPHPALLRLRLRYQNTPAITWPNSSVLRWPDGESPDLTTSSSNATDFVYFFYDGTRYFGVGSPKR